MRLVSVENLEPGFIVGRPVVDDTGKMLLNKGIELTADYIRALALKGYTSIYVAEADAGVGIEGDEDLDPVTRSKAILGLREVFEAIEHEVPNLREKSMEDLARICEGEAMRALMSPGGPFDGIQDVVASMLREVLTRSTLAGLASICSADSKLYSHSVDVCVVAVMIARAIGLKDAQLKQLATGCLLHDIGKVFVGQDADEKTLVRRHTLLGYELLKNCPDPDIVVPHVALEHHEWQDGSGEPRGLMGGNAIERDRSLPPPIPTLVGEIAAVANVYDGLLAGSQRRPPMTPDAVVQSISNASGTQLNREIVAAFVRLVPVYPLGTSITVRSGEYRNYTAIVSQVNPARLDRPIITIFRDNKGKTIPAVEMDLAEESGVRIQCKFS